MVKYKCEDCDWKGLSSERLLANHPFLPEDSIYGCPQCFEVCTMVHCCEEEGCWDMVQCGNPLPGGEYKFTCSKHAIRP